LDLDDPDYFNFFNDDLSNNFWDSNNSLLNNWDLDSSVNNLFKLLNQSSCVVNNFLYLFYSVLIDNFFLNNFNYLNFWNFNLNLNDLFNDLWNLNNFLDRLNDWDWLFMNNLYNLWNSNNVVDNLSSISVFN